MKAQEKPRVHPLYPWKCDLTPHADKKRQRKSKVADKQLRQVRAMKYRLVVFM